MTSSRRTFLRACGLVGVVSLAGCRDSSSTDTAEPTGTQPETVSPSTVIDDFESGELATAWQSEFDTSKTRTGGDGGRSAYQVQSQVAPQGAYALRGDRTLYDDGTSTILRDDFRITQEGTTIRLSVKLGEILDGWERDNRVQFLTGDFEKSVVRLRNKRKEEWDNLVVSEKLRTVERVELRNISFENSVVGEVTIGGETVVSELPFDDDIDDIGAIQLRQGHYEQPTDLIVDDIVIDRSE